MWGCGGLVFVVGAMPCGWGFVVGVLGGLAMPVVRVLWLGVCVTVGVVVMVVVAGAMPVSGCDSVFVIVGV